MNLQLNINVIKPNVNAKLFATAVVFMFLCNELPSENDVITITSLQAQQE